MHTVPQIMYPLNILSRYCNRPGARHFFKYLSGIKKDYFNLKSHDGPFQIDTMTAALQLSF